MKISSLEKGKVLHLPLDQESYNPTTHRFTDTSAYGNHGIGHGTQLGGSPVFVADRMGQLVRAAPFNGSDDYVELVNGNISEVYQNGDWTISFWMNPTVKQVDHVFSFKSSNTFYRSASDSTKWVLLGATSIYEIDLSPYDIVGQWIHYVFTYNAVSNIITIHVNDSNTGEGGVYIPNTGTVGTDKIGFRYTGGTTVDHLYSSLTDVRMWERALSQPERTLLYNSYKPGVRI